MDRTICAKVPAYTPRTSTKVVSINPLPQRRILFPNTVYQTESTPNLARSLERNHPGAAA